MTILYNDFETFSKADIRKVGGPCYARHPSTKPLMLAYAFDDEAVQQWVPAEGQKMPRDLRDAMRDPTVLKSAWNAQFELNIWEAALNEEVFFEEWRCSMVHALTLSLPGSLGAAGAVVGLDDDKKKDARGKQLIRMFCVPRKPTKKLPYTRATMFTNPDEWEEFKHYNRQDIVAERAIARRIRKWDLPDHEWDLWRLDQEINRAGIPVNMRVVENAIAFAEYIREKRYAAMRRLVGDDEFNPRATGQLLDWLRDNGYRFDDLKRGHVERAAKDEEMPKKVRRMCEMRLEVSKTSVDKYYAFERMCGEDGLFRGAFQFAGAGRTWRWAGRGVQVQNLPRPVGYLEKSQVQSVRHLERLSPKALELNYEKPMDLLSTCIRPTIQAPEGYVFIGADLNAIENRVLGWLADDEKILDVFEHNRDPYVDFATYMYDEPYEKLFAEFKAGDKSKRTVAKPGVLGCGYMLSAGQERENDKTGEIEATGLLGYAWNMGIPRELFGLEQAKKSVKVWRQTFSGAVEFWWDIEKAAKKCLATGEPTRIRHVRFDRSGPFMRMLLPSGRALHYCRPQLKTSTLVWCEESKRFLPLDRCIDPNRYKTKTKESIVYEGLNDKNKWGLITTHPGKLTENADQAISRDLLASGMQLARKRGLEIRLHVHDEIVPIAKIEHAEKALECLVECMETPPKWAKGLPLKAAGSMSPVFIKD